MATDTDTVLAVYLVNIYIYEVIFSRYLLLPFVTAINYVTILLKMAQNGVV